MCHLRKKTSTITNDWGTFTLEEVSFAQLAASQDLSSEDKAVYFAWQCVKENDLPAFASLEETKAASFALVLDLAHQVADLSGLSEKKS